MTTTSFSVKTAELRELGAELRDECKGDMASTKSWLSANGVCPSGAGGLIYGPIVDKLSIVRDIANGFLDKIGERGEKLGSDIVAAADAYAQQESNNVEQTQKITKLTKDK